MGDITGDGFDPPMSRSSVALASAAVPPPPSTSSSSSSSTPPVKKVTLPPPPPPVSPIVRTSAVATTTAASTTTTDISTMRMARMARMRGATVEHKDVPMDSDGDDHSGGGGGGGGAEEAEELYKSVYEPPNLSIYPPNLNKIWSFVLLVIGDKGGGSTWNTCWVEPPITKLTTKDYNWTTRTSVLSCMTPNMVSRLLQTLNDIKIQTQPPLDFTKDVFKIIANESVSISLATLICISGQSTTSRYGGSWLKSEVHDQMDHHRYAHLKQIAQFYESTVKLVLL